MRAAQAGDRDAFANLYSRYRPLIAAVISRHLHASRDVPDVEDLTSEVFLRAWRGIGRVTEQWADPSSWLITIARNAARDHTTSAHQRLSAPTAAIADPATGAAITRRDVAGDWTSTAVAPAASAETEAFTRWRRDHATTLVRDGVARLTAVQRASVQAVLDEEPNAAEAARTGSTVGAVKSRRTRALRALREQLTTTDETSSDTRAQPRSQHPLDARDPRDIGDPQVPAPRTSDTGTSPGAERDSVAAARAAVAAAMTEQPTSDAPTVGAWAGSSTADEDSADSAGSVDHGAAMS